MQWSHASCAKAIAKVTHAFNASIKFMPPRKKYHLGLNWIKLYKWNLSIFSTKTPKGYLKSKTPNQVKIEILGNI